MRLGIDVDGCLADFNSAFYALLVDMHGVKNQPTGYDPMHPPCWNWPEHLGYKDREELEAWQAVWQDNQFWQGLGEEPHASEALHLLDKVAFAGLADVYFITHRRGAKVKLQTERWLEARGIYHPTVIVTGDKVPVFKALNLTAVVDDKLDTLNAAVAANLVTRIYAKNCLHNMGKERHWNIIGVGSVLDAVRKELILNKIDI